MGSERYEVQERLPHLDQRRLAQAHVLVVGVGGLGCASASYLALAGVGRLRIVDGDAVAPSNLGRQILYREADIGRPKAEMAAERLREMNPSVAIEAVTAFCDRSNLASLLEGVDLVIDGTDSIGARELLNRAFVTMGVPVVFGAATGWNGSVFSASAGGPCYDCVWNEAPDASCETAGVLGPLVGLVGAAQGAEAVRVLLGLGEPGRLLLVDALRPEWRTVRVRRREGCRACGRGG